MSKNKRPITMTSAKLNQLVGQGVRQSISCFLIACIEEFGWQGDETQRAIARVHKYMNAVNEGLIKLSDMEKLAMEEAGEDIFEGLY